MGPAMVAGRAGGAGRGRSPPAAPPSTSASAGWRRDRGEGEVSPGGEGDPRRGRGICSFYIRPRPAASAPRLSPSGWQNRWPSPLFRKKGAAALGGADLAARRTPGAWIGTTHLSRWDPDCTPSLLDQDRTPSPSNQNVFELWRRTTGIERAVVLSMVDPSGPN